MKSTKNTERPSPPPIYHYHPPDWLPKSSSAADLGFPDFNPPNPKAEEDLLTETNIKNGYACPNSVLAETFSAQTIVNDRLQATDSLDKLSELIGEVYRRKHEETVSISDYSFCMPMRVTLNDAKRQSWFSDLANPHIPLHKLGKNVPHGAKGHDLLDLLHSIGVTIPRAVWFLRVSGANETSGLRNKPSYNPLQYSVDWANIFLGYLKKQLLEIALPSALRSGLNIKSSFKGILSDPKARSIWGSRFSYSLHLLRTFYDEGLVDNRTFLIWLVHQMETCNLAQAGLVVRLVYDYLEGFWSCRALSRPLIEACLVKLSEISSYSDEILKDTRFLLKVVLQKLCIAQPEAFISPLLWSKYSPLLTSVLQEPLANTSAIDDTSCSTIFSQTVRSMFRTIRARNEALLFRPIRPPPISHIGCVIANIKLLNSISNQTDMSSVPYFNETSLEDPSLYKLDLLLTWSVTPLQFGDHRPFVALTLLKHFRDSVAERASRRDIKPPDEYLQDALFSWLDTGEVAGKEENVRSITLLFGKLVKHEIFSYPRYIQRLIARGELGLSINERTLESRHRQYLRWIPLYSATPALQHQRKITLYGIHTRDVPEEQSEREIRKEVRAIMPELFGGSTQYEFLTSTDLLERCQLLFNATRYEQVRIFRHWLTPLLKDMIEKNARFPDSDALTIYCTAVELMAHAKCFRAVRDLTIYALENEPAEALLSATLDTIQRFGTIWNCSDVVSSIVHALYRAHQAMKRRMKSRPLMILLVTLDAGRHLPRDSRDQLFRDTAEFTHALQGQQKPGAIAMPASLPEIATLATEETPDAASRLANHIWLNFRSYTDWASKVWEDTIACLSQLTVIVPDVSVRMTIAMRYSAFLQQIDKHLPTGLNPVVLKWFITKETELLSLNSDVWPILTPILLHLVLDGAIQTTTLMQGVVYPAWHVAAAAQSKETAQSIATLQSAALILCKCLLLCDCPSFAELGVPLQHLADIQKIVTQKNVVYGQPHFPHLASAVLTLVSIEENSFLDSTLKEVIEALRIALCSERCFSRGVSLHLDKTKMLCEEEMRRAESQGRHSLAKKILQLLGTILGVQPFAYDSTEPIDIQRFSCPWQMTAAAIQFQLVSAETQSDQSGILNRLIQQLLVVPSDVLHFFAQIIHDAKSVVSQRFVENGLIRLQLLLQEHDVSNSHYEEATDSAVDFLQTLVYVGDSVAYEARVCPPFDSAVLENLGNLIAQKLRLISFDWDSDRLISFIGLLVRTLHFVLSFRLSWPGETFAELANSLLQLAIRGSERTNPNMACCSMLIDTMYYTLDVAPSVLGTSDPFKWYSQMTVSNITSHQVPREIQNRLKCLIPGSLETKVVKDLAMASETYKIEGAVVSRPWEWTESHGEQAPDTRTRDRGESSAIIPDTSSVSLRAFNAQPTGDMIVEELGTGTHLPTDVVSFFDNLTADSVFKRDWEESRFADLGGADVARSLDGQHSPASWNGAMTSPLRGSSAVSQSSAHGSTVSRLSGSSKGEAIDVDSFSGAPLSAQKRKAPHASEDEVEIVSGVSASSTTHHPLPKKPQPKPRVRKR